MRSSQTKHVILIIIISYLLLFAFAYYERCTNSNAVLLLLSYDFNNSNDLIANCVKVLYSNLDSSFIIVQIGAYVLYFSLFKMVFFDLPLAFYRLFKGGAYKC